MSGRPAIPEAAAGGHRALRSRPRGERARLLDAVARPAPGRELGPDLRDRGHHARPHRVHHVVAVPLDQRHDRSQPLQDLALPRALDRLDEAKTAYRRAIDRYRDALFYLTRDGADQDREAGAEQIAREIELLRARLATQRAPIDSSKVPK